MASELWRFGEWVFFSFSQFRYFILELITDLMRKKIGCSTIHCCFVKLRPGGFDRA